MRGGGEDLRFSGPEVPDSAAELVKLPGEKLLGHPLLVPAPSQSPGLSAESSCIRS